jgi:hypothetical protein
MTHRGHRALGARATRQAELVQCDSADDDQSLCDILPDVGHQLSPLGTWLRIAEALRNSVAEDRLPTLETAA